MCVIWCVVCLVLWVILCVVCLVLWVIWCVVCFVLLVICLFVVVGNLVCVVGCLLHDLFGAVLYTIWHVGQSCSVMCL